MTPSADSRSELVRREDKSCGPKLSTEHTRNSQLRGTMLRREGLWKIRGEGTRRPVSRVLCRSPKAQASGERGGHSSGPPIAGRFSRPTRTARAGEGPAPDRSGARRPYSVLLQAGLAMPPPLPETRCALTAPFHPCPAPKCEAVCFLWRYPWGRPRRALPAAYSPWSPDFPPSSEEDSDRPAVWSVAKVGAGKPRVKAGSGPASSAAVAMSASAPAARPALSGLEALAAPVDPLGSRR